MYIPSENISYKKQLNNCHITTIIPCVVKKNLYCLGKNDEKLKESGCIWSISLLINSVKQYICNIEELLNPASENIKIENIDMFKVYLDSYEQY